jgi:Tfp pilus assembly protein PilX
MRSSFRDRTRNQRGYVLITAIVLAILYFALMELMLIDSSRALNEAQRFRSRLVAQTLAESAAELAAVHIIDRAGTAVNAQDEQGTMAGIQARGAASSDPLKTGTRFDLTGTGTTSGVQPMTATVHVQGRLIGNRAVIDFTYHSQ